MENQLLVTLNVNDLRHIINESIENAISKTQKPKSSKSPSTLRRLVTQAETALTKATAELEKVTLQMRSAGNDHLKLAKISEDLAKAQAKVNSAEETWLTLVAEAE